MRLAILFGHTFLNHTITLAILAEHSLKAAVYSLRFLMVERLDWMNPGTDKLVGLA